MAHKHGSFAVLVIGLSLQVAVASAQSGSGSVEGIRSGSVDVTVFAGASVTGGVGKEGTRLQVENATPFGGRIAYNFDRHHAAEFSIGNPLSFSGNYVYHFSPLRIRFIPYATAGIGGSRSGLELGGGEDATARLNANLEQGGPERRQTAVTGNFGGGVKFLLTDRFAIRFDARDVLGRYSATFANTPSATGGPVKVTQTLNDVQLTLGVVLRLGGSR